MTRVILNHISSLWIVLILLVFASISLPRVSKNITFLTKTCEKGQAGIRPKKVKAYSVFVKKAHKIVPFGKLSATTSSPKEFDADDDYTDYNYEDSHHYFVASLPLPLFTPHGFFAGEYDIILRRYTSYLTSFYPPPQLS